MAISRLQSESDSGAPVRLVAERLKASGKLDGLLVRIGFLGQPDDLRGPILERLMGSDQIFGPPLMAALCKAQSKVSGQEITDFSEAFKQAGASFSRRLLLIHAIKHWSAIMSSRQGVDAVEVAKQSLAMAHIGLWFGKFSKTHTPDSCASVLAMHGISYGIMAATYGDEFGVAWQHADGSSTSLETLEMERFGIQHGEAAAILARAFTMHPDVVTCLTRHTLPATEIREFPLLMSIAEQCAAQMGFDGGIKRKYGELPVASMLRLGLRESDLAQITLDVKQDVELMLA